MTSYHQQERHDSLVSYGGLNRIASSSGSDGIKQRKCLGSVSGNSEVSIKFRYAVK